MAKTLLRGLDLIEAVGLHGPLTVSELSRQTGIDITIVSRTVNACVPQGWLVKMDGKISVGPRCALLGLTSPLNSAIQSAGPIVRALAGITGTEVTANGLVGRDVMILAASGGSGADLPRGLMSHTPIHVLAAGRAIAAQIPDERLEEVLDPEPYRNAMEVLSSLADSTSLPAPYADPEAGKSRTAPPATRVELETELRKVRKTGFSRDDGAIHPSVRCVAAWWPIPSLPASIACLGSRETIDDQRSLIEACLTAAIQPGAQGADIVAAAAAAAGKA